MKGAQCRRYTLRHPDSDSLLDSPVGDRHNAGLNVRVSHGVDREVAVRNTDGSLLRPRDSATIATSRTVCSCAEFGGGRQLARV